MFYLHYIISVLLVSNLFIFTKEQSPFPPHCPRCNNENQKDRSEAREKKSVQELSMFTLFLFPSPNLNYVSRDHYIGLLKIFFFPGFHIHNTNHCYWNRSNMLNHILIFLYHKMLLRPWFNGLYGFIWGEICNFVNFQHISIYKRQILDFMLVFSSSQVTVILLSALLKFWWLGILFDDTCRTSGSG